MRNAMGWMVEGCLHPATMAATIKVVQTIWMGYLKTGRMYFTSEVLKQVVFRFQSLLATRWL